MKDIATIYERFWALRRYMPLAVLAGAITALVILYNVTVFPPKLERKSATGGFASADLLIDSRRSSLTNLTYDVSALASRAQIFVGFIGSADARDLIADGAGIDPRLVQVNALYQTQRGDAPTPVTPAQAAQRGDAAARYRVDVYAQESLPVISVAATAPDGESAERLATAASDGMVNYLRRLRSSTPPDARTDPRIAAATDPERAAAISQAVAFGEVRFRRLGEVEGSNVASGTSYSKAAAFGAAVTILVALLIMLVSGVRNELRMRREAEAEHQAGPARPDEAARMEQLEPDATGVA